MTNTEIIRALQERLTPYEERIIRGLYGIGTAVKTDGEIARALAITPRRLSRAELYALGKLSRAYGITARDLLECDEGLSA